jgi:hypothetical protein
LPEGCGLACAAQGRRAAVAIRALAHFDPLGADRHRALGDDDVAVEDDDLLDQVDRARQIGLDRQRLAAVAFFGACRGRQPAQSSRARTASGGMDSWRHRNLQTILARKPALHGPQLVQQALPL